MCMLFCSNSLAWLGKGCTPFIVPHLFAALPRTPASTSMALLNWRAQNRTQHSKCASPVQSKVRESLPCSCWLHYFWQRPECCWPSWPPGDMLDYVQPAVDQHPQIPFHWTAFQPLFLQPATLHGLLQDLALGFTEPHTVGLSPSVPLQRTTTLQSIL